MRTRKICLTKPSDSQKREAWNMNLYILYIHFFCAISKVGCVGRSYLQISDCSEAGVAIVGKLNSDELIRAVPKCNPICVSELLAVQG